MRSAWTGMRGYPAFYYKTVLPISYTGIISEKRHRCRAFVYIMHEERSFGIPTKSYLRTCLERYQDFGFDDALLRKAVEDSWEELQHEDK